MDGQACQAQMKAWKRMPMTVPMRRLTLACLAATLVVAAPASAFRLGHELTPLAHNPANAFSASTIDDETYDGATHCSHTTRPGVVRFTAWVAKHSRGVSWGTYRCEKWGPHEASLHAENRALDWHLDVSTPPTGAPRASSSSCSSRPTRPGTRTPSRAAWASRR